MPVNHPYDPRYNAKIYIPKLTEEERRARATPLENLRSLRFRSNAPAAQPSPPKIARPEIATPQDPAPEPPTVETPTADVPMVDASAPEPAAQDDPAPDYHPAAWEVVFAAFPELYPEHAAWASVVATPPGDEHATPFPARPARTFDGMRNQRTQGPSWRSLDIPAPTGLRTARGNAHVNTRATRIHAAPT